MSRITKDTTYDYKIGKVKHEIKVQAGSLVLLDDNKKPLINQEHMIKMNALFKSWIKFADKHNVKWVCQGGTLLGAARQSHGHLYWDDDIDVNIMYDRDYEKLYDLQGVYEDDYELEVADSGFNYHHRSEVYPFIDVWVLQRSNQRSNKYIMAGPFINKQPQFYLNEFWPKEYMYKREFDNRIKVKFEDYEAYVPKNYVEVVKRQFCEEVLTSYYYDKFKEAHADLETDIFIKLFTCRNRNIGIHTLYKFNDFKYIYLVSVNYSHFAGTKQHIVDKHISSKYMKTFLYDILKPPVNLLRTLGNTHS